MPPLAVKGVDLHPCDLKPRGTYKVDVLQISTGPTLNTRSAPVADLCATNKVDVLQIKAATRNA